MLTKEEGEAIGSRTKKDVEEGRRQIRQRKTEITVKMLSTARQSTEKFRLGPVWEGGIKEGTKRSFAFRNILTVDNFAC